MRLIVADSAGTGQLWDKDGAAQDLDPDNWRETDVRDSIVTGDGQQAWVRYREDGRTVEVPANTTYRIEYVNEDVIDRRGEWDEHAASLVQAMDGAGTDETKIFEVLGHVSGSSAAQDALTDAYRRRTGNSLADDLRSELSGSELDRALRALTG